MLLTSSKRAQSILDKFTSQVYVTLNLRIIFSVNYSHSHTLFMPSGVCSFVKHQLNLVIIFLGGLRYHGLNASSCESMDTNNNRMGK